MFESEGICPSCTALLAERAILQQEKERQQLVCEQLQAALRVRDHQLSACQQEIAGLHDIVARLWALTDPDVIDEAGDLATRVHQVLGANDPDGHCGNELCAQLSAAESQLSACQQELETVTQNAIDMEQSRNFNRNGREAAESQLSACRALIEQWRAKAMVVAVNADGPAPYYHAKLLRQCADDLSVLLRGQE